MGVYQTVGGGDFPPRMYITDELVLRSHKTPDYLQEKRAIQNLAARMVDRPEEVLPSLVDLAMELTGAISAGISLFEENPAPGVFRWRYLRGTLAPFDDALTPRNFSPCGITLDQNRPVLCNHPEQFYDWISDANIVVPEVLLVPLYIDGKQPLGTLWIVAEQVGHFSADDARVASELAAFAGIALRMTRTEATLQAALGQQESLTGEMSHRIKNLFATADGLVRLSARGATSVEEMRQTLSGRFHALASAHGLVRRTFADLPNARITDLIALLGAILKPYERSGEDASSRFTVAGPDIALGDNSLNGFALIFHELATNAAKYGALKTDEGKIAIDWSQDAQSLTVHWRESGGPKIDHAPDASGFGTKLLRDTIIRQFGGSFENQWDRDGLTTTLRLPSPALQS
jgi:two-component sensor histidine kinase